MGKTFIGFATHWYQPPTQRPEVIGEIIESCYRPFSTAIKKSGISLSIDMAQSLGEKLPAEILKTLRTQHLPGRIEFVNTAAYHYLLALSPHSVIARQLRLNENFYRENFCPHKSRGLFPPELALSPSSYGIAHCLGYQWLMADDEMFRIRHLPLPEYEQVPQHWIPVLNGCGVLLRSRLWSNVFSRMEYPDRSKVVSGAQLFRAMLSGQEQWRDQCRNKWDSYLIIALDAETFGHHHRGAIENILIPFFEEAKSNKTRCEIMPLQEIFERFPKRPISYYEIAPGSWSTGKEDIDRGIPFPLWNHPDNQYHRAWNDFQNCAFQYIPFPNQNKKLQFLLDRAFYSCSPWWAGKENPDDRKIAGWCLPMFRRIAALAPPDAPRKKLASLADAMEQYIQ